MTLARLVESARSQDLRAVPEQAAATRRILDNIARVEERLRHHRAAVDDRFLARRAARAGGVSTLTPGETSLANYPVGFCGDIRDHVLERLVADPVFRELIGPATLLKKVFVLLKGSYFQNALQLANLYVDVANDTVAPAKPKIEWLRIEDTPFENADSWTSVAAVGRRYYDAELYPNLLFPLAFPCAPFFAIRASGRIDLFNAQNVLFLKDLGDGLRRARALLDDPSFTARRLPEAYERLVADACGDNLQEAFPLEYAPTDAAGIRARVLPEFDALARRDQDPQAAAIIDRYMRLMESATRRLTLLNLRPAA